MPATIALNAVSIICIITHGNNTRREFKEIGRMLKSINNMQEVRDRRLDCFKENFERELHHTKSDVTAGIMKLVRIVEDVQHTPHPNQKQLDMAGPKSDPSTT